MSKDHITLIVDADDTIENLVEAWCHWLNKSHGTNVTPEDITQWDMQTFFPTLSKDEVFAPLHEDEFWKTVKPKYDAIEYLQKLQSNGFDIYICTATDYRNVRVKYEYIIKKYFPFISWKNVIVASNKQMIHGDCMIDDAPQNLIGGLYRKILFSAPHNKSFDEKSYGITRVETWEEAYKVICDKFCKDN